MPFVKIRKSRARVNPGANRPGLDRRVKRRAVRFLPNEHEAVRAVATWREEAARLGLTQAEIDRMASAFEREDLDTALSLP